MIFILNLVSCSFCHLLPLPSAHPPVLIWWLYEWSSTSTFPAFNYDTLSHCQALWWWDSYRASDVIWYTEEKTCFRFGSPFVSLLLLFSKYIEHRLSHLSHLMMTLICIFVIFRCTDQALPCHLPSNLIPFDNTLWLIIKDLFLVSFI